MSATQYTIFNTKMKFTSIYPNFAVMGFYNGTQERIRNSHGKRVISVRAIGALLYIKVMTRCFCLYRIIYALSNFPIVWPVKVLKRAHNVERTSN